MTGKTNAKSGHRTIAVFDFDGTLVKGDTLFPFLVYAAGWPRALLVLAAALVRSVPVVWKCGDIRTAIKEQLLQGLLAGKRPNDLTPAIEKLQNWIRERSVVMNALREHHRKGHHIVIASGSLSLYLPALLSKIPHHAVVCTDMEIRNGQITGRMTLGNCVRARKAERIAEYLSLHGPFDESWGYGNAPHDVPMLDLFKHRVIV